jgi:hypothetical protein
MQTDYPQEMVRRSSGRTEIAYSRQDEVELRARGYELLHEQVDFRQYPMMLSGDGLPDLIVENEDQAKEAAGRGYDLPSQAELALAEEGFAAAHEPPVEDYVPSRFPLMLRHPLHRDAIPVSWIYDIDGVGTAIPGQAEEFPDVIVYSPGEEDAWRSSGWTSPALPPADEPPVRVSVDAREYEELLALKRAQVQPRRKPLSGAARRKLHRLRGEQQEIA